MDVDVPTIDLVVAGTALGITVWSFWMHARLHRRLADCYLK